MIGTYVLARKHSRRLLRLSEKNRFTVYNRLYLRLNEKNYDACMF